MTDEIIYQVPFGIFGSFAHILFVRRTLERIFRYRRENRRNFSIPNFYLFVNIFGHWLSK